MVWYPTRLLELYSKGTMPYWRLVETHNAELDSPYITLSHCWGSCKGFKLSTTNYDSMTRGKTAYALPRLYQDAMYVTRELGVKYLWIDWLCIIQTGDDLKDWKREASLMGDVYSRALCNISALNAADNRASLFHSRDLNALSPPNWTFSVHGEISHYEIHDQHLWVHDVSSALLSTRAWVLQERLLSPRILHFGGEQMFWECRTKYASESYPNGISEHVSPGIDFKYLHVDESMDWSYDDHYDAWSRTVEKYSTCALTFQSDKLVAISAIAKLVQSFRKDEYIAGIWGRTLEKEMLWRVSHLPVMVSGSQPYRCPTWSWAAVNGRIEFESSREGKILFQIDSYQLDYATTDKLGLLRGGWIQVRASLRPIRLSRSQSLVAGYERYWKPTFEKRQRCHCSLHKPHSLVRVDAWYDNFDEQNNKALLYYFYAFSKKGSTSTEILLLEVVDEGRGIFKRIGWGYLWCSEEVADSSGPGGNEDQYPCIEYKDGRHVFRVI